MKNIYDFLNESRGMDVLDRDEYRAQDHTDPLIRNRNNRAERLQSMKNAKLQNRIADLFFKYGEEVTNTFSMNKYNNYIENYVLENGVQFEDMPASTIFNTAEDLPNDVVLSFIHLNQIKDWHRDIKNDAKYNLINNYFIHDRRMNKFIVDNIDNAENLKPGLMIYAKDNTLCLILVTGKNNGGETADVNKYFDTNWNDIVYTVKEFYKLYSKINDYNNKIS